MWDTETVAGVVETSSEAVLLYVMVTYFVDVSGTLVLRPEVRVGVGLVWETLIDFV